MSSSAIDTYLASIRDPPDIYPHQKDAIDWMYYQWTQKQPILLADSMGLGKTLDICMLLELIRVQHALLVVPTSTIYQWVRNLLTYSKSYYVYVNTNHTIRQVMLGENGRIIHSKEAPIEILNYNDGIPKVTVCNYHAVEPFPGVPAQGKTTGHKIETGADLKVYYHQLTPFKNIVWDVVIADEVHKIRNGVNTKLDPGETRKKMLIYHRMSRLQMNPNHSVRIGLTGTPVQNRFSDVVSILTWLGCNFPPRATLDDIKQMLQMYMFRRTEDDLHPALRSLICFPEMPPVEHNIDVVYESQAEADVYRIVAGSMSGVSIPGGELNPYSRVQYEENPLVRTTYLRLLSADINQFIISHNKRYESIVLPWWRGTTSKINMIADKIKELAFENESVVVFIHYKEERDAIREKVWYKSQEMGMGGTFGYEERWIDGDVAPEDREYILYETKKIVEAGGKCIIYATMQSSSDGLNMQYINRVIISTTDWNPANELQAIKRTHRIGQRRLVVVYRYIHRYIIDLEKKSHIDVRIEEKKMTKKAKADELITNAFNAAKTWTIREMPGWKDEPCVVFRDIYDDELEAQIAAIGIYDDETRPPDRSYTEKLIGHGAGVRTYNPQDVSKMVDNFYATTGSASSVIQGLTSGGSAATVAAPVGNPFGAPVFDNIGSVFNMGRGNTLGTASQDITQRQETKQEEPVLYPHKTKLVQTIQRQQGTDNLPLHLARAPVLPQPTVRIANPEPQQQLTQEELRAKRLALYSNK